VVDYQLLGIAHTLQLTMSRVTVDSPEIARASLHRALPWYTHLYTLPFLSLYPLLAYAYYIRYDDWLGGEEWTFLACVSLGAGHALSFLVTKWSAAARAWVTTSKVSLVHLWLFKKKLN
jgi:manganese-transporting P-type ATPase